MSLRRRPEMQIPGLMVELETLYPRPMFPSLSVAAAPIQRLVASGLKFTLLKTWGGLAPGLRISTSWTPATAPPVGPILAEKTRVSRLAPRLRYASRYMGRMERESNLR